MKRNKKPDNKANSIRRKLCPFSRQHCLQQKCALWIIARKESANPLYTLHFEGCGLIQNLPWTLKENSPSKRKATK
jgi:hypothetical protein